MNKLIKYLILFLGILEQQASLYLCSLVLCSHDLLKSSFEVVNTNKYKGELNILQYFGMY